MKCFLYVRHKVKEYTNWRLEWDCAAEWRRKSGEKNFQIFRDTDDLDIVTIMSEWENVETAKKFVEDSQFSEVMQKAGVMGHPILHFLYSE